MVQYTHHGTRKAYQAIYTRVPPPREAYQAIYTRYTTQGGILPYVHPMYTTQGGILPYVHPMVYPRCNTCTTLGYILGVSPVPPWAIPVV